MLVCRRKMSTAADSRSLAHPDRYEQAARGPGDRRALILALSFFAAVAIVWIALFTTSHFFHRDAHDYAQIGRQIRNLEGYTSRQIFPRYIPYFQERGYLHSEQWPSLLRYPITPTLSAFVQLMEPDVVRAGVIQSGICFLLSVPLFFLLARRLTNLAIASLATVVYVGDPRIWRDGYNGMTESVAILLLLGIFYTAFHPATHRGSRPGWLLLGVLCGLAYLSRTQLILLFPLGVALALARLGRSRGLGASIVFVIGIASAVVPWLVRNYAVTGNPLFAFTTTRVLMAATAHHTRIDRELDAPVDVATVIDVYGEEILAKVLDQFWPNLVDPAFWLGAVGAYAVFFPLFCLAVLFRKRRPPGLQFLHFEIAVLVFTLINFLIVCVIYHRQRYYDILIPFLVIVIVRRIWWLIELAAPFRSRVTGYSILVLLFVAAAVRATSTLVEHASLPAADPLDARSYQELSELVGDDSIVASDVSAKVTLFNGNRSVRLPNDPEEILEINQRYIALDYVLASEGFQRPGFRTFTQSEGFRSQYHLVRRLPNRSLLYKRNPPKVGARQQRYYAAQLHLHGSLSEGLGTMRGHNMVARRVGTIEVLWWTDHDWRVARYTYLPGFYFEARTTEKEIPYRGVPWRKPFRAITFGWVSELSGRALRDHTAGPTEEMAVEGRRSLVLEATAMPNAAEWGCSQARLFAKGGRFKAALAADVVLRIAVNIADPSDEDTRVVVKLKLSRQPEGLAELRYVLGDPGRRRVEGEDGKRVGIVPLPADAGGWSDVVLPVTEDAVALGLGGWDNGLNEIRLGVCARRGAEVTANFDDLRIETKLTSHEVLERQQRMALDFEEEFGLVNHVGSELSASFHMNAYLPRIELPDFERFPHGMQPREIVAWAHERGGLASYNHMFGTQAPALPAEEVRAHKDRMRALVINNRAYSADLLEVGYPQRSEPLIAHLEVWDQLSARRIFLTAIGSSDSHDQNEGWTDGNNFVTWIWARSPRAEDLIDGLRQGRAFLGDSTRFRGSLDLETEGGLPMGRVVVTDRSHHDLRLRLTDLPENTRVRWIVHGQEARRSSPPGGDFEGSLQVDTREYRFVRVEVWQGERGLAFSNCLYFVPASEGGAPETHRTVTLTGS